MVMFYDVLRTSKTSKYYRLLEVEIFTCTSLPQFEEAMVFRLLYFFYYGLARARSGHREASVYLSACTKSIIILSRTQSSDRFLYLESK